MRRRAVIGLGDAARDAGQGVAVAAERDGVPDGVFVRDRIEEGDDGLGDRSLAGDVELVGGADLVDVAVEVVAEEVFDAVADRVLGGACAREEDGDRDGLGALDALRVIMGDGQYIQKLDQEFRLYRKYSAESEVKYDSDLLPPLPEDQAKDAKEAPGTPPPVVKKK